MNNINKNTIKIIAADDDPITAIFWSKLLATRPEYQITFVVNGKELLNSNWQHSDIIFTDINMPEVDGITAAKEISSFCNAPIIGVTANHSEDVMKACLNAGIKQVLQKPLRPNTLAKLIDIFTRK